MFYSRKWRTSYWSMETTTWCWSTGAVVPASPTRRPPPTHASWEPWPLNSSRLCRFGHFSPPWLPLTFPISFLTFFIKRVKITWNDVRCPTKWRESSIRQTLQVRVTSGTQNIQYSAWPTWCCTLWRKVNSRIFVGQRTSFQAVCRYVYCVFGFRIISCYLWWRWLSSKVNLRTKGVLCNKNAVFSS